MDNANHATQASSENSVAPMEQFDQELDQVEAFVAIHQMGKDISPAATRWIDLAKEQAYLKSNPQEGLNSLRRARVAALRFHVGQTILQANSLKEQLGQKANRQASYLLGHAKLAFDENNLVRALPESQQSLELFTAQVKQIEERQPQKTEPAPLKEIFQVPSNTGTSPKQDAEKLKANGDQHVAALHGKKHGNKPKSDKKPTKGKKKIAA